MEVRSQFSGRYKKDRSLESLRAKVTRRKSITQKENRNVAFKKRRGQALAEALEDQEEEQSVVEEANEGCNVREHKNKPAIQEKTKAQLRSAERQAMLERYKEEKRLRKLKEQQERAKKPIFNYGIYRPEKDLPVFTPRTYVKKVNVTSLASAGAIAKVRGQTSVVKNERQSEGSIPSTGTTTSAANAPSEITPADKAPLESVAVQKLTNYVLSAAIEPGKLTKETRPELVIDISEPPVVERTNEKVRELEPICIQSELVPETIPVSRERLQSFAPEDFVFKPLGGFSPVLFLPMTPKPASALLTTPFTWTPTDWGRKSVVSEEICEGMNITYVLDVELPEPPVEPSLIPAEVKPNVNASPQDNECASDASSAPHTSPAQTRPPCEPSTEEKSIPVPESLHDVPYFRDILKSELEKLTLLCNDWNKRIEIDIPEDAKDLIRTTVGQTKLLMTERFKQFEGLVDDCEFKRGEKETTCTDLNGFWDMIYFQIEDVRKKFANLEKLEENSWQQDTVQTKTVKKKIAPAAAGKPKKEDTGRAAARSRLAAIKAAMKNKVKTEDSISEVETPVIPAQRDPIVFDAGFFRIESPAKLPGSLRKSRSSLLPSPKSAKKNVQISGTPIADCVEDAAEEIRPAKSLSPANCARRTALFDPKERLRNQEEYQVVPSLENAEADSVPTDLDMTKYLVPSHTVRLGAVESPGLLRSVGLETTQDGCDAETDVSSDVFMCSPARDVPPQAASLLETLEPDDAVKTTSEPLDVLNSSTPMVHHSPMTLDFDTPTDLITFSPMEK